MTLNGVMAVIMRFFTIGANCATVVEVRLVLSAIKMWPKESTSWQYMMYGDILKDH